jgi:hypothetical protein
MIYYLSERRDGRIVLEREAMGVVLQKHDAPEPSFIRREVDGEMVDVPIYGESFAAARTKVNEKGLIQTSEGWFRSADAYLAYVRSRLGEAEYERPI